MSEVKNPNLRLVKNGKTYEIYVATEQAIINHVADGWTRITAEATENTVTAPVAETKKPKKQGDK